MEVIKVGWVIAAAAIGFFTIVIMCMNEDNVKYRSKLGGSIIMTLSGGIGVYLAKDYMEGYYSELVGTTVFGVFALIGFIIYLLSSKIHNSRIKRIKAEVEELLEGDTIEIDSGEGFLTVNKSDIVNITIGALSTVEWTIKDKEKTYTVKEIIKPGEKCTAIWLMFYHMIPYHQINEINYMGIAKRIDKKADEIKNKMSPSKRNNFEQALKTYKKCYISCVDGMLSCSTYFPKKPLNPYIAAGIANGIAGPLVAAATFQESTRKQESYNESMGKVTRSNANFERVRKQLINGILDLEKVIKKDAKASKYWEELKASYYLTYDKYLDSLIIK